MSRATDGILNGIDPLRKNVSCHVCGRHVSWPAAFAAMAPVVVKPLCTKCDGSGDAVTDAADLLADIPGLVQRSCIPGGVSQHKLDQQVYDFLTDQRQSTLLLTGPTHTGKTAQAVNLIRRWCSAERLPAFYRTEVRMLSELRNFKDGQAAHEMHRLCTAPLLVIDDVGTAHTATESWALEQYMRIIDDRYRSMKTVITSNLELGELWQLPYIDGRIQRRLEGSLVRMQRRA